MPFPSLFLPFPLIPFKTWSQIFENYLLVIRASGDDWPNAQRRAVLLHCLGTEGQRFFYSLLNTGTDYDSAMAALLVHFSPKAHVVERHAFCKRTQALHETFLQYVAALCELASTCDFGDHTDKMMHDQLVESLYNPQICESHLLDHNLALCLDVCYTNGSFYGAGKSLL